MSSGGYIIITIMHDEGHSGKRNKLLLLARWRRSDGTLSDARLIGCLDTSKSGSENARAIKARLNEMGLSSDRVLIVAMTVDGAGRKALRALSGYGLVYVIVCDAHNLNKEAEQFIRAFAKSNLGMLHPYNLTHNLIKLIRVHVEVEPFFMYAAEVLNKKIREGKLNAAPGIAANVPEDPITPELLQKLMKVPDIPTLIRWLTIEVTACWIMDLVRLITDARFVDTVVDGSWFTRRGIVLAGLEGVFNYHAGQHWFATDPTSAADIAKWGPFSRVSSLQAQLTSPYMLAELSLLSVMHISIFGPALELIRTHNRAGGGARFMLAETALRLDQLTGLVLESTVTFTTYVPRIVELVDRVNFVKAARLYVAAVMEKCEEHLCWAGVDNLPVALAHSWIGGCVCDVILKLLQQHDPAFRAQYPRLFVPGTLDFAAGALPPLVPSPPFSVTHDGKTRELGLSAVDLAELMRQQIMVKGGPTRLRWWSSFTFREGSLTPSMLTWRRQGCRFLLGEKSRYRDHFECALEVADSLTLKVEKSVNDSKLTKRAIGSSNISAAREQGRMLVHAMHTRVRHEGDVAAHAFKRELAERKGGASGGAEAGRRNSKSRVSALFRLAAARQLAASVPLLRFEAARASARARKRDADVTGFETELFKLRLKAEAAVQAKRAAPPDFAASVAAAAAGQNVVHLRPEVHGLVHFGRGKLAYSKSEMLRTLVDRRGEEARASLVKLKPPQLQAEMVTEFYGVGWTAKYAPKLMERALQDEAVRVAKLHCTPETGDWAHKLTDTEVA